MAVEPTPRSINRPPPVRPPVGEAASAAPYIPAVRAHLAAALLVLLATVAASSAYLATRAPTYKATARILINPVDSASAPSLDVPLIRNSGEPDRTLQTAVLLIQTRQAAAAAAAMLPGHWTADRVQSAIQVVPAGQSSVLDVIASADSPALAATVANAYVTAVLAVRRLILKPAGLTALAYVQEQLARIKDPASAAATALEQQLPVLQTMSSGGDPNISHAGLAIPAGSAQGAPAWLVEALALLAGIVLATGTALTLEALAPRRIRTEQELSQVYPLAILARSPAEPPRWWHTRDDQHRFHFATREAFRTLRLQLELTAARPKVLMITSPTRGDGKSGTAVGLARELAESGAGVVLVDADLREPGIRRLLGLRDPDQPERDLAAPKPAMITDLAEGLEDVPAVEGLKLIDLHRFLGTDSSKEVTHSIAAVIRWAVSNADYVIIDTAPLGEVSDALSMIESVDEVIVVARLGNSRYTSLQVLRDLLGRTRADPAGYLVVGSDQAPYGSYYRDRPIAPRSR